MAAFWKTQAFKILNEEWYGKLDNTGFIDAEKKNRDSLISNICPKFRTDLLREIEQRQEYFRILGHLVHDTIYESQMDFFIMIRYSEGKTIKEITIEALSGGFNLDRKKTGQIINRWLSSWGINNWDKRGGKRIVIK